MYAGAEKHTDNKEIIDGQETVLVDHRPELIRDGAGHDWRSDVLTHQFTEAQTKPISYLLVAWNSPHRGFAEKSVWLNAVEDTTTSCTQNKPMVL